MPMHRIRRFGFMVACCLGMAFFANSARAGTCRYVAPSTNYLTLSLPLTGSVTAGRDIPVGAEIYRARMLNTSLLTVGCEIGSYDWVFRILTAPQPLSSYVHPVYGRNVYETGVPGVGAVLWASASIGIPGKVETYVVTTPNTTRLVNFHSYYVSLIKTGNISAGTVSGANLPTFEYVSVGDNTLRIQYGLAVGSVNIVASTCTTPDVSVNLGSHRLDELGGVGTSTSLVDVPIQLTNCPAFFGSANVVSNNGSVSRTQTNNIISLLVAPTTSILDAANGVMALQAGGATGMGIQLINKATMQPLRYGAKWPSGLALTQTANASYLISLQARYYQTSAVTTPGQANGSATVTLYYE